MQRLFRITLAGAQAWWFPEANLAEYHRSRGLFIAYAARLDCLLAQYRKNSNTIQYSSIRKICYGGTLEFPFSAAQGENTASSALSWDKTRAILVVYAALYRER